jgi:hypothetical protein
MNLLRSCAGCSAHILTNDGRSQYAWCLKCRKKHVKPWAQFVADLKPQDRVYVQPSAAWRGLSHSEYVIVEIDRERQTVVAQVLGIPESRQTIGISQLGQLDMTPRPD